MPYTDGVQGTGQVVGLVRSSGANQRMFGYLQLNIGRMFWELSDWFRE